MITIAPFDGSFDVYLEGIRFLPFTTLGDVQFEFTENVKPLLAKVQMNPVHGQFVSVKLPDRWQACYPGDVLLFDFDGNPTVLQGWAVDKFLTFETLDEV
jgi:hypothetical protein